MALGWHYTKLSLSALLLSFSGMCISLLFPSFCRYCFVLLCFLLSLELCIIMVDIALIFFCPAEHVQYRIGNHVYFWVWLRPDRLM